MNEQHRTPFDGLGLAAALVGIIQAPRVLDDLPTDDCPPWCVDAGNHPYRSSPLVGDDAWRMHRHTVYRSTDGEGLSLHIDQLEQINGDKASTLGEPQAHITGELTTAAPESVRELAERTSTLAAKLAELQAPAAL